MGTELETRRNDRMMFFQILKAQETGDLNSFIANLKAGMEQEDIKIVLQEFEEWKKNREINNA